MFAYLVAVSSRAGGYAPPPEIIMAGGTMWLFSVGRALAAPSWSIQQLLRLRREFETGFINGPRSDPKGF
jgi:hypothetical protein